MSKKVSGTPVCDVDLTTEKRGSPHAVVAVKNRASYERRAKRHRQDLDHVAVLGGCVWYGISLMERKVLSGMSRKNRVPLADRVANAAKAALAATHIVSAIDVLIGIGWLDPGAVERWRRGQIDCLEEVVQVDPPRIAEAMELFASWAAARGLSACETAYVARAPQRQTLCFSRSRNPTIETSYRTHWIEPELSEKKRERLVEKAGRAPELVVIQPLNAEWVCHRCGGNSDLLMMEPHGPVCLRCAGLDDLEFLPAGDALLTRRAKANSPRYAVVVRFSRTRRRYERRGLLVEPRALADARADLGAP